MSARYWNVRWLAAAAVSAPTFALQRGADQENPAQEPAADAPLPEATTEYSRSLRLAAAALKENAVERAQAALESSVPAERDFEWKHLSLLVALQKRASEARAAAAAGRASGVTELRGHEGAVLCVAPSPDGTWIASSSVDRSVRVWNAAEGTLAHLFSAHAGAVRDVAWSSDGRALASCADDGMARVFDLQRGERLSFRVAESQLSALAWSADGARLAIGSPDGDVRVFDAGSALLLQTYASDSGAISAVSFELSGVLVSASLDGYARAIDLEGGAARVLGGAGSPVHDLAVARGAGWLALARADGTALVVKAESGDALRTLAISRSATLACAFTPSEMRLASGSADGAVRIVDVASGDLLLVLRGHEGAVHTVSFTQGGSRLVSGGADKHVRLWETDASVAERAQIPAGSELPSDAQAKAEKPWVLAEICVTVLLRAGAPMSAYERAAELLDGAFESAPDDGRVQSALGAAQYRLGRWKLCLETLEAAHEKRRGWPVNLGFRALAKARLGEMEAARALAKQLEIVLRESRWSRHAGLAALREEVRHATAER